MLAQLIWLLQPAQTAINGIGNFTYTWYNAVRQGTLLGTLVGQVAYVVTGLTTVGTKGILRRYYKSRLYSSVRKNQSDCKHNITTDSASGCSNTLIKRILYKISN